MRIEFGSTFSRDLHGIAARSDCSRRVNDNTAAIVGAYQCKKREGMTDIKFRLKLITFECPFRKCNKFIPVQNMTEKVVV